MTRNKRQQIDKRPFYWNICSLPTILMLILRFYTLTFFAFFYILIFFQSEFSFINTDDLQDNRGEGWDNTYSPLQCLLLMNIETLFALMHLEYPEVYLEPNRTSKVELFGENS